ncbi:MAG TPA: leucyl aminopeptidase family protein [Oligoflexia bacterium]|nr:leucyl aminopeptidase family protein [Oligoflexia bacterium]HMP26619.1 leucyl aminopeptidase family protein [Oligoflexia bacterium]
MKITFSKDKKPVIDNDLLLIIATPKNTEKIKKELGNALVSELEKSNFKLSASKHFSFSTFDKKLRAREIIIYGWPTKFQDDFLALEEFAKIGALIQSAANQRRHKKISVISLSEECKPQESIAISRLLDGINDQAFNFEQYKNKKEPSFEIKEIAILGVKQKASFNISKKKTINNSANLARSLTLTPANDCTPKFMAETAKQIARENGLKCEIFDAKALKKIGANLILAVGGSSDVNPPYLVKLTYEPPKKSSSELKTIALVGKGITFDTGGLCVKPDSAMLAMKNDMAGSAIVLATIAALAKLKPNIRACAYLALAENAISPSSMKPGDVYKSLSGKTVEIIHTDAEGRLVLADALALAVKDKAGTIIDVATLTGAAGVALGDEYTPIYSDNSDLIREIVKLGQNNGERYWRMPLAPEYKKALQSKIADLRHHNMDRLAGSITAALFLKEFVEGVDWAHLDIAYTAKVDPIKGTSRAIAVRTLIDYCLSKEAQ